MATKQHRDEVLYPLIAELHAQGLSQHAIAREVKLTRSGVQCALRVMKGGGYRGRPSPDWLVYAYYDAAESPLYIGYTDWLGKRDYEHSTTLEDQSWYRQQVCRRVVARYGSETEARAAEKAVIATVNPRYNKTSKVSGIDSDQ